MSKIADYKKLASDLLPTKEDRTDDIILKLLKKILSETEMETPDELIEYKFNILLGELKEKARKENISWEEFLKKNRLNSPFFEEELRKEAKELAGIDIIMEAIYNFEDLKISDDEIKAEMDKIKKESSNNEVNEEDLKIYIESVLKFENNLILKWYHMPKIHYLFYVLSII